MTPQQFAANLANVEVAIKTKINQKFPTNQISTASSTGMNEAVTKLLDDLVEQITILSSEVFFTSMTTDDITEGTINLFLNTVNLNNLLVLSETTTDNLTEGETNEYYTQAKVDARIIVQTPAIVESLKPSQSAPTSPTGGSVIDIEARASFNALITKLQAANIID